MSDEKNGFEVGLGRVTGNRAHPPIVANVLLMVVGAFFLAACMHSYDHGLAINNSTQSDARVLKVQIDEIQINETTFDLLANSYMKNKRLQIGSIGQRNLSVEISHRGISLLASCRLPKPNIGERCLYKAMFDGSSSLKCVCDSFDKIFN